MAEDPFSEGVVRAVVRHMNDDHAADSVLIVRVHGGVPDATEAVMTGMDAAGIDFAVRAGGGAGENGDNGVDGAGGAQPRRVAVRIPWREPVTGRAQIRRQVVEMYDEALAALGLPPRPAADREPT